MVESSIILSVYFEEPFWVVSLGINVTGNLYHDHYVLLHTESSGSAVLPVWNFCSVYSNTLACVGR